MIRVRRVRSEDVSQLIEIARASATAAQWTQAAYARMFAVEGSRSPVALVVEEDGFVKGFLAGREIGAGEWEIENIAIHGPARRRGLGTRLLGEFLEAVRSRGGNDVYLEVRHSNRAARALYEKWGFWESGVRKAYYQSPEEDALILRFSFPQRG
jgi:ribosomal-protein-alanine N-acetyltransferase